MKKWQKITLGIAAVVIPGSLIAAGAIAIYKVVEKKRREKKEKEKVDPNSIGKTIEITTPGEKT